MRYDRAIPLRQLVLYWNYYRFIIQDKPNSNKILKDINDSLKMANHEAIQDLEEDSFNIKGYNFIKAEINEKMEIKISALNKNADSFLQYPLQYLIGKPVEILIPIAFRKWHTDNIVNHVSGNLDEFKRNQYEHFIILGSGFITPCLNSFRILRGKKDNFEIALFFSPRKSLSNEEGYALTDNQLRILNINSMFFEIFGRNSINLAEKKIPINQIFQEINEDFLSDSKVKNSKLKVICSLPLNLQDYKISYEEIKTASPRDIGNDKIEFFPSSIAIFSDFEANNRQEVITIKSTALTYSNPKYGQIGYSFSFKVKKNNETDIGFDLGLPGLNPPISFEFSDKYGKYIAIPNEGKPLETVFGYEENKPEIYQNFDSRQSQINSKLSSTRLINISTSVIKKSEFIINQAFDSKLEPFIFALHESYKKFSENDESFNQNQDLMRQIETKINEYNQIQETKRSKNISLKIFDGNEDFIDKIPIELNRIMYEPVEFNDSLSTQSNRIIEKRIKAESELKKRLFLLNSKNLSTSIEKFFKCPILLILIISVILGEMIFAISIRLTYFATQENLLSQIDVNVKLQNIVSKICVSASTNVFNIYYLPLVRDVVTNIPNMQEKLTNLHSFSHSTVDNWLDELKEFNKYVDTTKELRNVTYTQYYTRTVKIVSRNNTLHDSNKFLAFASLEYLGSFKFTDHASSTLSYEIYSNFMTFLPEFYSRIARITSTLIDLTILYQNYKLEEFIITLISLIFFVIIEIIIAIIFLKSIIEEAATILYIRPSHAENLSNKYIKMLNEMDNLDISDTQDLFNKDANIYLENENQLKKFPKTLTKSAHIRPYKTHLSFIFLNISIFVFLLAVAVIIYSAFYYQSKKLVEINLLEVKAYNKTTFIFMNSMNILNCVIFIQGRFITGPMATCSQLVDNIPGLLEEQNKYIYQALSMLDHIYTTKYEEIMYSDLCSADFFNYTELSLDYQTCISPLYSKGRQSEGLIHFLSEYNNLIGSAFNFFYLYNSNNTFCISECLTNAQKLMTYGSHIITLFDLSPLIIGAVNDLFEILGDIHESIRGMFELQARVLIGVISGIFIIKLVLIFLLFKYFLRLTLISKKLLTLIPPKSIANCTNLYNRIQVD